MLILLVLAALPALPGRAADLPACGAVVKIEPTVLWQRRGQEVLETVNLVITSNGLGPRAKATVHIGDQTFTEEVVTARNAVIPLMVRDPGEANAAHVHLESATCRQEFSVPFLPARKWKLFVCPSTHLDIGYTTIQTRAVETHQQNLETALDLIDRHPSFRWNVEGAWIVKKYLAGRNSIGRDRFLELARQGKVGLEAFDFTLQTGLCSLEELNRATEYAFRLGQRAGIRVEVATVTDVPSLPWSLPSVLAGAGVRYLAVGANQARGPLLLYGGLDRQSPFFWEGPDGQRVLVWYTQHYAQARRLFGVPGSLEQSCKTLPEFLAGFGADYPYDGVLVFGHGGDNATIGDGNAAFYEQWNATYAYPQIIPARYDDFFHYVEAQGTAKLPVFRGDGGAYWEDGAGECPRSTARNRRNQAGILDLEKLASLALLWNPKLVYPAEEIQALWEDILLFDEHTFGARASTLQSDAPATRQQWTIKRSFADRAASGLEWATQEWLGKLEPSIPRDGPAAIVWNLSNWARTGTIELQIPARTALWDPATGRLVPCETLAAKDEYKVVRCLARDVPPLGYRLYRLGSEQAVRQSETTEAVLENAYYRVSLDARRGGIGSIYDKQLRRELVNPASPYAVGEYLYVTETSASRGLMPGDGTSWTKAARTSIDLNDPRLPEPRLRIHRLRQVRLTAVRDSPAGQTAVLEGVGETTPRLELEVHLPPGGKRLDLIVRLRKECSQARTAEAVYFAFPFALESPRFAYELPLGWADPARDMLPGGATEWFSIQNWVSVSNHSAAVTLITPDAPLVTLGDLNRGKWPRSVPAASEANIFSYAMNNYWLTNFPGGQEGGEFLFRYTITSGLPGDYATWSRLGEECRHPLLAEVLPSRAPAPARPLPVNLVRIDAPNVNLVTMKAAHDGSGFVLRLAEIGGRAAEASLDFGALGARRAFLCSTHEIRRRELAIEAGRVRLPLSAHSQSTVLVELHR